MRSIGHWDQRRNCTSDESLDFYGIKSREEARNLVRRAHGRSNLDEKQALDVAQREVRAVRRKP